MDLQKLKTLYKKQKKKKKKKKDQHVIATTYAE